MKYFQLILLVLLICGISSCQRQNPVAPTIDEAIHIEFFEDKIEVENGEYIYRQSFEVTTQLDDDTRFAYRLSFLREESDLVTDAEGWLLFGGSIWTDLREPAFDFLSQNGKLDNCITGVEIRIKGADGKLETLQSPFKSSRTLGTVIVTPFNAGAVVSMGIEIGLKEAMGDIYVDGMYASHFMYRLSIVNENNEVLETGEWHNSQNMRDIRKIILNPNQAPALAVNAEGTLTKFESYVVSRSGMEQAEPTSTYFRVVGGNQPVALIYPQTLVALGEYHSVLIANGSNADLIPPVGNKYPCKLGFWENSLHAINSADFRLHLRWGYSGQYGVISPNGVTITNIPGNDEINSVLNPAGQAYRTAIDAFWLRLNAAPFPHLNQFVEAETVYDDNGANWLRVKNVNDLSRHSVLTNLPDGLNSIELMVEDLQGVCSASVQTQFYLHPFRPVQQRSGVLIIDDSQYNPPVYEQVDTFYDSVIPMHLETEKINLRESAPYVPPAAILQNYKCIFLHADNPMTLPNLHKLAEELGTYLGNEGNLILSSNNRLPAVFSDLEATVPGFLAQRMGILNNSMVTALSASLIINPYFVEAQAVADLPDLQLNLTDPYNPIVDMRQGLSTISMFEPALNLDWIYRFGCKSVDHPTFPPTQEQYDNYSQMYVAYRHQQGGSKVYVFGFPLSFMEEAPVAEALGEIFNDIMGGKMTAGRK